MARILLISPYEPPSDGIARHTGQLVEAWDSAGHSVLVISPGRHRSSEEFETIGSHSKVARILQRLPRRRTWVRIVEFQPDMVFVQFAIAALGVDFWSVRRFCKNFKDANTPVVVAYHEPAREYHRLGYVTRLVYQAMARVTDVPIVFSQAGRQALIENDLFDEVVEAPHGTTGLARITDADIRRVRDLYRVQKPLVLTLGYTHADKGTDVLLDAARLVAERRGTDVQFIVAGSPRTRRGVFRLMGRRDIKLQRQLEQQAKSIADVDIDFFDYVADENVAALLSVADVVVLPYRRVTQSGIANLALSSRSVIVSSDLPGLRSDLGDVARYVGVGDSRMTAEQILTLLDDESASLRERMRDKSGDRAEANTYAKVAEAILTAGVAKRA